MSCSLLRIVLIGMCAIGTASAHHSRSNYDLRKFLEYDGTVVEFAWKNPHAYAVIEVDDNQGEKKRLLLEMNSKPILTGMGWTESSLKIGDQIHVRGNPDRRGDRDQFFVGYVINRDGEKLWSFGRPREEARRQAKNRPTPRTPLIGSKDFAGVWNRARLSNSERRRGNRFEAASLAVTKKGEAARQKFDPNDDPTLECLPRTLPQTIVPVYPMEIIWEDASLLTFRYHFNNTPREVHIGQTEFPRGVQPSRLGYSIGSIEDGVLTIHSKYFTYDRWGNGRGIPSGEQKEVTERYTLTNDGKRMEVSYRVTDPEYLAGPAEWARGAYVLRNNVEVSDFDCDPHAAKRHLIGE